MPKRKSEFFTHGELTHQHLIANPPKTLFSQERDWTCSIACIRTLLSGVTEAVPSEKELIQTYALTPGPHYSKDIERYQILKEYDVIYGCNSSEHSFDDILDYLQNGYFIMLESMYNYAHWMVLLGYYPLTDESIESSQLLLFDPYYNQVRLLNTDEFISMWRDGNFENTHIERDFIAMKMK